MIVKLTPPEVQLVYLVAPLQVASAVSAGRQRPFEGDHPSLDAHVLGMLGEVAVAKACNLFWNGTIGQIHCKDVGTFQVRSTYRANGHLLLHPEDRDDDPFIFCVVNGACVDLKGWISGRKGKAPVFWQDDDPARKIHAAYFVPTGALEPMTELVPWLEPET